MRRSVTVLTNGHLCRNPRVLKEATALGKAGYNVVVVGVRNHPASDRLDADLLQSAPFRLESLNLLPGGGPSSFLIRLEVKFRRSLAARGIWKSIGALGPARALLRAAQRRSADLTICHNEIAHWAGVRLLDRGCRVAADVEDWHSEDLLPEDRKHRPIDLLRSVERTLLQRCSHVTTTSEALARALHARYGGRRPEVITNSFPLQPDPLTSEASRVSPARFFWFSQTLGPGRGLESFLCAWGRSESHSEVVLLGEARRHYADQLRRLVPPGCRSKLSFRALVPPDNLPGVIADHDIGLALEDASIVNRDLTITNKILQYLNAGLAVVATPTAGQREVLSNGPQAGIILDFNDTDAPARLREVMSDGAQLRSRRTAARRLSEMRYCWEREEPVLLAAVARSLAGKHPI
jgi:glycosyltransferase involved in cell wall biosynthesis